MSNPEGGPRQQGWFRMGVPNETPEDLIEPFARQVDGYFLKGVVFESKDIAPIGTVVEISMSITGWRELTPRESLSPEELEERDDMEFVFHEFTPDET